MYADKQHLSGRKIKPGKATADAEWRQIHPPRSTHYDRIAENLSHYQKNTTQVASQLKIVSKPPIVFALKP